MKALKLKRIYETKEDSDGYRILVDRLWPRGISKEHAHVEEWLKELGPSNELRKWFGHQPELYPEFKKRYEVELKAMETELKRIKSIAEKQQVCLVYSAKDEEHNQAQVLKEVIESL